MSLGIPDLAVGHWTDRAGLTGCTVVIPPPGNVASVSVRGGGPGTRETDVLAPSAHVQGASALLLTGGSAFGLAAADGVAAWCERRGMGYGRFGRPIPIVPAAVVFDLGVGDWDARPGPASGAAACDAATVEDGPMGNVGAGTGATVGKTAGMDLAMKGGLGWVVARSGPLGRPGDPQVLRSPGPPVTVGALAVVNAGGDVVAEDGTVIAGTRHPGGADAAMRTLGAQAPVEPVPPGGNTTLGLIVTDGALGKPDVHRVAVQAHDGMARAIRPAHTSYDGDTVFAVALGRVACPVDLIAFLAEEALAAAIRAGVRAAAPLPGIPAAGPSGGGLPTT
ncbi:MAG TPA: P1 family peptidase [Actinomycetes bacterium]|nr:P1 family peptidase [Actinomycetes bacterium]